MDKFETFDDVLDFAISEEEAAARFYRNLSTKVDENWMKTVFEDFAKEEDGHKRKLESIKEGKTVAAPKGKVIDLKIGDYLIDVNPNTEEDLGYQEALIIAMKKEKAAFRLYSDLARQADSDELKNIFLMLAQEEAKHKLRFEVEYDDVVYSEN
jgi:rubrerythrin